MSALNGPGATKHLMWHYVFTTISTTELRWIFLVYSKDFNKFRDVFEGHTSHELTIKSAPRQLSKVKKPNRSASSMSVWWGLLRTWTAACNRNLPTQVGVLYSYHFWVLFVCDSVVFSIWICFFVFVGVDFWSRSRKWDEITDRKSVV